MSLVVGLDRVLVVHVQITPHLCAVVPHLDGMCVGPRGMDYTQNHSAACGAAAIADDA
jgi:hypothetical protein